MKQTNVKPADGKLGIMIVGNGAVATTFMTGVFMTRRGLAKPIGSMTQYDKIRVGRGADKQYLHYSDIVPLAKLDDIVFGTWDVYPQNAYQAAMYAEVLKEKDINPVKDELEKVVPMKAAFDRNYAKRLDGDNVKDCKTRWDMVEQIRQDIRDFKQNNGCSRIVVIWAASTEIYVPVDETVHGTLAALEAAMKADDREHIAPSMCYAYAALTEGAPFIMGAPNTTVDIPAMWELAEKTKMPIAGKDFKTGQTLVKSGFAPIIGTRCLGLSGWFSTNILGNRDGLVLGICNGFQALIKLGLVPYGDIRPITAYDPTLTFNTIGRHQSMLVRTRVASNKSPWLSECNVDDEHLIAISHGEGRFVCNDGLLQQLINNGQVATQYVDLNCVPTMDMRYNPNGSVLAIEGITSPDGRVFGKMGHSERSGDSLYKNVTGDKYQPIFEGGVNYFKL